MPGLHADLRKATPVHGQIDDETTITVLAIGMSDLHIRTTGKRDDEFLSLIADLAFGLAPCAASCTAVGRT